VRTEKKGRKRAHYPEGTLRTIFFGQTDMPDTSR